MFNVQKFFNDFEISIRALQESERITKDALRALSRSVLEALHTKDVKTYGDIQYTNRLLGVLSPMNKRTFVLFMQEFSGFLFKEDEQVFSKKDKRKDDAGVMACDAKRDNALEHLLDPHFNLWTWAERNVKVEKKTFRLDTLSKDVKKAMDAKDEEGNALYSKADIIKAILSGGIDAADLLAIMDAVEA